MTYSGFAKVRILAGLVLLPIASAAAPTFHRDIAPILYKNCAGCHRPGEVAPFSLLTYADAGKRAASIAAATQKRYMPPWKAEPGYGHFQNERRLSDAEIALIGEWAKAGAPEGDPKDNPPVPVFPEGWQLGKPDREFKLASQFTVAAEGRDQFRCFVIPMNLEKEVFVKSFEFRPDNRKVVHHALIYTDATGASLKLAGGQGSYPCFGGPGFGRAGIVGGWAPGSVPVAQPAGMAITLRPGTNLVLQIHYHPSGKPELDQSSLGMTFGEAPTVAGGLMLLSSWAIDIAPGDSHYVAKSSMTIPNDVEVFSIGPHAHYLCRDMKVTAHNPDGTTTPLIWIKDWDFNWQGQYRLAEPVKLAKGTRLELEYTYDNSAENPRNPSRPPVRVRFGEQTTDEMAIAFVAVKLPEFGMQQAFQRETGLEVVNQFLASGSLEVIPPDLANLTGLLRTGLMLFDKDKSGKLDDSERKAFMDFIRSRVN